MTRKNKGIAWLVSPFVLIVGSLVLFAVVNFIFKNLFGTLDPSSSLQTVNSVLNLLLTLASALGVLDFFIGIPVGIYFLVTTEKTTKK
jgi:hypothetical protein